MCAFWRARKSALPQNEHNDGVSLPAGPWPDPRLRALQVDELYRHAPLAAWFSYFVSILTLGVLIETGDMGRGVVWFLWATAVTFFRFIVVVLYRRRQPEGDPSVWGRLIIAGNILAGLQWAILGTVLFAPPVYRELFTAFVITCLVGGSLVAYAPLRWAHEALSITAGVPFALNLVVTQGGAHFFVGITALFFCFTIVFYARQQTRHIEEALRLQLERDGLLSLTAMLNEKLSLENRELAHRAAVRGVSVEQAREVADRLAALFEGSPLPQLECDANGAILACNAAAERFFGETRAALTGRPLTWLLAPADAGAVSEGARQAMMAEVHLRGREGGPAAACVASFTPLPEVDGRRPGFGVTLVGSAVAVA